MTCQSLMPLISVSDLVPRWTCAVVLINILALTKIKRLLSLVMLCVGARLRVAWDFRTYVAAKINSFAARDPGVHPPSASQALIHHLTRM